MPVWLSTTDYRFPAPEQADEDGLLAVGGDLSTGRLLEAYRNGIFPWFDQKTVPLWWCPDPRFVLFPEKLHVSRSMQRVLKHGIFQITINKAFQQVISACARAKRIGQKGTWIIPDMQRAYIELHESGYANSIEAWQGDQLVGGLYGIRMGKFFFGESMFSRVNNASKAAFIHFVKQFAEEGGELIDCQVYTDHLYSLGAGMIPREEFLARIKSISA